MDPTSSTLVNFKVSLNLGPKSQFCFKSEMRLQLDKKTFHLFKEHFQLLAAFLFEFIKAFCFQNANSHVCFQLI